MRTDELDYDFDPALVASEPANPRDAARMLVYDRSSQRVEHRTVRDLPDYLRAGDALVVNETYVAPARIKAVRAGGAHVEGLLLERRGPREWTALLKNARRVADGESLALVGPDAGAPSVGSLVVLRREGDGWRVRLDGETSAEELLDRVGWTPLPPYILRARKERGDADDGHEDRDDRSRYQTVYAQTTDAPSVAAPTAGLHFTPELLAAITARGVERVAVSLQVGAGTFKPVEAETLEAHPMHSERCVVTRRAIERLDAARRRSGRIVVVGTTSVRTLESYALRAADLPRDAESFAWDTDLKIAPGYRFAMTDALLTNFHLPRSTLIALVGAFVGMEKLKELYAIAVAERYRFYSYGDAMLIV